MSLKKPETGPPSNLIHRMLSGDQTSFDDIILWYSNDVLRLSVLLLQDKEEARDVVQESFIRLVQHVKAGKFRKANGSIKGFLLTVSRNLCLDRLKKRSRFFSIDLDTEFMDEGLSNRLTPDRMMDEQRFQTAFENALLQLTDLQRTILVLHELNGESNQKIAKTLEMTVNSITTHLCRARRRLRKILAPFGGE